MERRTAQLNSNSDSDMSSEICRLSWFLIEVNMSMTDGSFKNTSQRNFCIIHFVDIVDEDSSNMYINRIVHFKCNHNIVQGKILMASDDRKHVAKSLESLLEECEDARILDADIEKRFLVQYTKGTNNVFHSVVQQKEIFWPVSNLSNQREIFIKDGRLQRVASVLFAHEDAELVYQELEKLKSRCFDAAFDEQDKDKHVDNNTWLLLQYSPGPAAFVHAIVNMKETVWQEENLYKDVVAYLSDGITVFQGIIIRKSKNREVLDQELRKIKELCSTIDIPSRPTKQKVNVKSFANIIPMEEEEDAAVMTLKARAQQMESRMYHEATMIADAFEAIDQTRKTMNRRLYLLQNTLN